ncbi:hypothetical protein CPB83DRAFT_846897 [Crepidotus variabilis]|uniref:SHSP domain-containing protein n=1 Tax=Crepidotus variabilis TaxID=179855 RepID=A0A9P6EP00_9AGAR|nr:hypothetical protein CPB83DRAFT_846897 [Crepidotus variabilis]
MPPYNVTRRDVRPSPSPVTPAVTGIVYPRTEDASTELESYHAPRPTGRRLYTHPNIAGSTIEDVEPPADARSLDLLWGNIRQEKEKKMAKERPKVQSLEEMAQDLLAVEHTPLQIPLMESPPLSGPRKQKSVSEFRESTDGRAIVATFELPDVAKEDIHVSFQRNKLVLTWESGEINEWEEEDGVVLREHVRKMFHRTLPLPEGTRFEEIRAQMTSRGLVLRYPNMRCYKVESRSRSGDS